MGQIPGDVQPALGVEAPERKAQILDAMRDAEMCVLQRYGRDKNPYRSSGDVELEEVWDQVWDHHIEFKKLQSSVVCLEEVLRRLELRAKGSKR